MNLPFARLEDAGSGLGEPGGNHRSEGPAGAARFRLELGRHIVIQGERRSHVLMLLTRHHDVNARRSLSGKVKVRVMRRNTGVTRIMTAMQEANARTVLGNFPLPDLRGQDDLARGRQRFLQRRGDPGGMERGRLERGGDRDRRVSAAGSEPPRGASTLP
ncbi:MAG: hypothetical protein ACREU8_00890 [Gammaproteobacteria bacterium]